MIWKDVVPLGLVARTFPKTFREPLEKLGKQKDLETIKTTRGNSDQ